MKLFQLSENQTSIKTEILAGLTTFCTMAYIIILAPYILSGAGMDYGSAFIGTCLITALASFLSGALSNLPVVFAPGLGLLSYFVYVVVNQLGYSWQAGLGAVLISGLLFFVITITKLRQFILAAIPKSLGCAIAAGVGFFIGFIALKNIGVITENPHTLVSLGEINTASIGLFFLGFFLIAILEGHEVPGAIILGMLLITMVARFFHLVSFHQIISMPPSLHHSLFKADIHPLLNWGSFPVIFTFFIVALFDSTGTLIGLSYQMHQPMEKLSANINKALLSESIATTLSSAIGLTTLAPFVESASGIRSGGRTGLTAWVAASLFLIAIFFSPLAISIPTFATSAALFYVACIMVKPFAQVNWEDAADYIPAVITLLSIPLTFSIADGVGLGVICYVTLKFAMGKYKDIHPMMYVIALMFIGFFLI